MKKPTNVSQRKKVKKKKKLTYAQQIFKGTIKMRIGDYKHKIWPNQAIQDLPL